MKVSVLKSNELNDQDWIDLTTGFNESFSKTKKENELKSYYKNNFLGYSFHAIARNESGNIVGHTSIIPYKYVVDKDDYQFGLSGGSYILKEYRKYDFLFKELYDAIQDYCKAENLSVIVGIPNKNSFKFFTKILDFKYLKDLNYHILPIKPFKILNKQKYTIFDNLMWGPLFILLFFNKIFALLSSKKEKEHLIHLKLDDQFLKYRFNEKYQSFKGNKSNGIYRIFNENGVRTAYIMDFRQNDFRTLRALVSLINYIVIFEKIDAIIYIGEIKMKQLLLFKIPKKMIPQQFPLTYNLLVNENPNLNSRLQLPENWDFGLINFDVR